MYSYVHTYVSGVFSGNKNTTGATTKPQQQEVGAGMGGFSVKMSNGDASRQRTHTKRNGNESKKKRRRCWSRRRGEEGREEQKEEEEEEGGGNHKPSRTSSLIILHKNGSSRAFLLCERSTRKKINSILKTS